MYKLKHRNHEKVFLSVLLFVGITSSIHVVAQDLTISGGNCISTMICANGNVFAWGQNSWMVNNSQTFYGSLGTGNTTDAFISTPTLVNLPAAAKPIKQVDAGSGSHIIAMGCNGTVWCWGGNGTKQIGNTNCTGAYATTPYQVMAGQVPSSSGFLEGVAYISGGNDENYAILGTGELVAWGQNDVG